MAVLPSKIEPRSQHTMGRSAISTKLRRIIVLQYDTAARHKCISEQKVGSMGWRDISEQKVAWIDGLHPCVVIDKIAAAHGGQCLT